MDGTLKWAVKGQLLFKERGISGAWRSGLRKAVRAEDTGHMSKLCVETLFTSKNFHSSFRSFLCIVGTCIILHSVTWAKRDVLCVEHCFIIHLIGGGHCPLASDSEPTRLLEIATSPTFVFANNNY